MLLVVKDGVEVSVEDGVGGVNVVSVHVTHHASHSPLLCPRRQRGGISDPTTLLLLLYLHSRSGIGNGEIVGFYSTVVRCQCQWKFELNDV